MPNAAELNWSNISVGVDDPAAEHRFAVGAFDNWQQLRAALRDLRLRGFVLNGFNCLALRRIFAATTITATFPEAGPIEDIAFPDEPEPIACTFGPLADHLTDRLLFGARSLTEVLNHWLIPRHAAHFEDTVRDGKILFWVKLADAHDERRAYRSLLAHSSSSVGVHDLVAMTS
jgi:hypothetical protein